MPTRSEDVLLEDVCLLEDINRLNALNVTQIAKERMDERFFDTVRRELCDSSFVELRTLRANFIRDTTSIILLCGILQIKIIVHSYDQKTILRSRV